MKITYDTNTFPNNTLIVIPENRFEDAMIAEWVKEVATGHAHLSDLGEIIKNTNNHE